MWQSDPTDWTISSVKSGHLRSVICGQPTSVLRYGNPTSKRRGRRCPMRRRRSSLTASHVMGHIGKAVDTVRKQEHRALMASGNEALKGSKYLWLYSRENVPAQRREEFAALRRQALKVGRRWKSSKKRYAVVRGYSYLASGWKFWKRW